MRAAPQAIVREQDAGGLIRFIAIGATGALSFVVLSSGLIWLRTGVADWVLNTVSYAVLIVPVYLLHRRFSFHSDVAHRQALPRYMTVQGMALLLTALFSYLVHGMMLPTLAASMLVILLTSGINFVVLRSWAFARSRLEDAASA